MKDGFLCIAWITLVSPAMEVDHLPTDCELLNARETVCDEEEEEKGAGVLTMAAFRS